MSNGDIIAFISVIVAVLIFGIGNITANNKWVGSALVSLSLITLCLFRLWIINHPSIDQTPHILHSVSPADDATVKGQKMPLNGWKYNLYIYNIGQVPVTGLEITFNMFDIVNVQGGNTNYYMECKSSFQKDRSLSLCDLKFLNPGDAAMIEFLSGQSPNFAKDAALSGLLSVSGYGFKSIPVSYTDMLKNFTPQPKPKKLGIRDFFDLN